MRAIVLGAGKGKRLMSEKFDLPKVMREANGRGLITYVLDSIDFIPKKDTVIVVGYKKEAVIAALSPEYKFAVQEEMLGTGHAVMSAANEFEGYDGDVLIAYGDMPLFTKKTFSDIIKAHKENGAACTLMTAVVEEPLAYGRIIRDENGNLVDMIETKDCTPEQLKVKELNVGVYVFNSKLLFENLKKLGNNNAQGEYYLTDMPKILMELGEKVATYTVEDSREIYGVNTPEDLAFCESVLASRK